MLACDVPLFCHYSDSILIPIVEWAAGEFLIFLDSFVTGIANSTSTYIEMERGVMGRHKVAVKSSIKTVIAKWHQSVPFSVTH